jgi:phospholipid transport system substrate-binding protein
MKHLFQSFLICFSLISFSPAQANPDAENLAKSTVDKVLQVIRTEKSAFEADPSKLYALVDNVVLPNFDFERMAKLVLAQNWNAANDDQKSRFIKEFRALIVRTYARSLLDYTDQEVKFLPSRSEDDRRATVRTEVVKPGTNKAIPIDYDMYLPKNQWKVYDVKVDGVSLVMNYRSSYAEEIRKSGLDGLIDQLKNKSADAMKSGAK